MEIESFCNDVGDENEIHKGESPVVPGLLIIKKSLGEMTTINSLLVNFYKPVYSEQEVFIKKTIMKYLEFTKVLYVSKLKYLRR